MPFVFFAAIFILISVLSAKAQANKEASAKRARQAETATIRPQPMPEAVGTQRTDIGELAEAAKRRAEEARRIAEAITGKRYDAPGAAGTKPAKPAAAIKNNARPIVKHSDDDCGGGSIHDGYHEGVSANPFGENKPHPAVAGNLGKKLAEESSAQQDASNAQRAIERISKLPPMTQGIVFSEILGKPKAELS